MVKKIVQYQCEFAGCGKTYGSEVKARECETKGVIGPDIEPGLVMGHSLVAFPSEYIIFTNTSVKGHERKYTLMHIFTGSRLYGEHSRLFDPRFEMIHTQHSDLEMLVKKKSIGLLGQDKFEKINRIIQNDRFMKWFLEMIYKIDRLYRTHPYFER